MPSNIFTYCNPQVDKNGSIWIGNTKGLIILDLKKEKQLFFKKLSFLDIIANGNQHLQFTKENNNTYEVNLSRFQDNLKVEISGFIYSDPDYINYEYMLDGKDDNWQILEGKSDIFLYDLNFGSHVLRIRRIGIPESEIQLIIKTPINVFYIIAFISLVVTILIYLYSLKLKKSKSKVNSNVTTDVEDNSLIKENDIEENKYKTNKIPDSECKALDTKLKEYIKENRPYINKDLKIADLASQIDSSSLALSYLFNQYLKTNYYDFINEYRIKEFKRLANKEDSSKYTLSALAELSGFSSRASFFRSFKKATGITPNEYIKEISLKQTMK